MSNKARRQKKKRRPSKRHEFPRMNQLAKEQRIVHEQIEFDPTKPPALPVFNGIARELQSVYKELIRTRWVVWAVQQMDKRERYSGLSDSIDALIAKRLGGVGDGRQSKEGTQEAEQGQEQDSQPEEGDDAGPGTRDEGQPSVSGPETPDD